MGRIREEFRNTCPPAWTQRGLCLEHGELWKRWCDPSLQNRVANMHTPDWPTFEAKYLYSVFSAFQNIGWEKGVLDAKWDEYHRTYAATAATLEAYKEALNRRDADFHSRNAAFQAYVEQARQELERRDQQLEAKSQELSR
ncbi:uncharacterized protein TM35_000232330 [Trypanosoma theileri]|uniref:Uncharacterized protein n=1 Tax=Trypanosoma theileri TaxID=67003 RepID=A0A1X0NRC7_9TRYP|nr:uncharacterized protein TM35_000232330 [Trypanosoma theileri]ORC87262.1 hypothetical protein TM35_000232330 [Trypanosoma theileri]